MANENDIYQITLSDPEGIKLLTQNFIMEKDVTITVDKDVLMEIPTADLSITTNGTHRVKEYATVTVNVQADSGYKKWTEEYKNTNGHIVTYTVVDPSLKSVEFSGKDHEGTMIDFSSIDGTTFQSSNPISTLTINNQAATKITVFFMTEDEGHITTSEIDASETSGEIEITSNKVKINVTVSDVS